MLELKSLPKPIAIKNTEQVELSYISGGDAGWSNHFGKQLSVSFIKMNINLPCNQVVLVVAIYPKNIIHMSIQRPVCEYT